MGGPWAYDGEPAGWGRVDDAESIRAIHCALEAGINFFDTAANYGCGHSEQILGQAVAGRRDIEFLIQTLNHSYSTKVWLNRIMNDLGAELQGTLSFPPSIKDLLPILFLVARTYE